MSKRIPLSTQLYKANERIAELEKAVAKEAAQKDMWYKKHLEENEVIEQLHTLLDVLPGAPGRVVQGEESWQKTTLTPTTRIAGWLASQLERTQVRS